MKKIIVLGITLILAVSAVAFATDSEEKKPNIEGVEITYGVDKLSFNEYTNRLKEINANFNGKKVRADGEDFDERLIEIYKLSGIEPEKVIENMKDNRLRGLALGQLKEKYQLNKISDSKVLDYIDGIWKEMTPEDQEILLLLSGYSTFEEYRNSPKTMNGTRMMLLENSYVQYKINEIMKSKSSLKTSELIILGKKESKDEMEKTIKELEKKN